MESTREKWWGEVLLKVQNQENLSMQTVEEAWSYLWDEWRKADPRMLKIKFLPSKLRLLLAMRKIDPMVMFVAPTFLVSIFAKELSDEEIVGFMNSFYKNNWFVDFQKRNSGHNLVYTNGFGGDQISTINISTPATIIAGAAGAKVLKMGSHSYFGKSGAQNFTDEIGYKALETPEKVLEALGKSNAAYIDGPSTADSSTQGIANFMSKIPEGKEIMKALFYPFRYQILCFNFFNARIQQRGISTLKTEFVARLLLATIKEIDIAHITAGMDNSGRIIDEVSNVGKTKITVIKNNKIHETFFTSPSDWGVKERKPDEILGGFAKQNVKITLEVLMGKRDDAYSDLLAINASQLLYLGGVAKDIKSGTQLAKEAIASGKALEELKKFISSSGGSISKLEKEMSNVR